MAHSIWKGIDFIKTYYYITEETKEILKESYNRFDDEQRRAIDESAKLFVELCEEFENKITEVKTNKNGVNSKIKAHILSDEEMRKIGFTDYRKTHWYFSRMIYKNKMGDISFGVSINKTDPSDLRIDVLDENWCQPYDYQYMLEEKPNFQFAREIKNKVEEQMAYLQDAGVLSGHVYGEYI